MFDKANPKILGIVFVALLVLVLIVKYSDSQRGERSFKSELITFSTDEIDQVSIFPNNSDSYSLVKKGDGWKVDKGEELYPANEQQVKRAIDQLASLKVNQVVATSSDSWGDYEVSDSAATKVEVKAGDESVGLLIGKLNFDQRTRSAVSYVRQAGDDRVYGVDGFLRMSFGRGAGAYRQKTIVSMNNKSGVKKISFDYPADSSFVLTRNNNRWMVGGQLADSASVDEYFKTIRNLKGSSFADIEEADFSDPIYQVRITGEKTIEVAATRVDGRWVVHSSLTPGAYFSDMQGTIREKLFASRKQFLEPAGN